MQLSVEQQNIVVSPVGGLKIVKAGAGSGKTRVITERVKNLLTRGIMSQDFLLITFTNKAGREMSERLKKDGYSDVKVGTFHRVGMQELRMIYEARGQVHTTIDAVGLDKNFSVLTPSEANRMLKYICDSWIPHNANFKVLKKITSKVRDAISYSLNTQQKLSEVIKENREYSVLRDFTSEVSTLAKEYFVEKQKSNTMDYDDILFYWYQELMQGNGTPYKIVIIDEYQDSNALQDALAFTLFNKALELFVVGDANQAIYAFRGSKVENIIELIDKVPDAQEYVLGTNYRSDERIVKFSEQILKGAKDKRFHMDLKSGRGHLHSENGVRVVQAANPFDEADFIYEEIDDLIKQGVPHDEIAILYRSHRQSLKIEKKLYQQGIPYEMRSGKKFFERDHIQAALGYLRLIRNPADKLAWVLILEHKKGVGAKSLQVIEDEVLRRRVLEHFANTNGVTEIISLLNEHVKKKDTRDFIQALLYQIIQARNLYVRTEEKNVYALAAEGYHRLITKVFYDKFENKPEELTSVQEDFNALESDLTESNDLDTYIDEFYLVEDNYLSDDMVLQTKVTLSTVHRSKGLEWDYVFIVGANYKEFPSPMNTDYDEERRLMYGTKRLPEIA